MAAVLASQKALVAMQLMQLPVNRYGIMLSISDMERAMVLATF